MGLGQSLRGRWPAARVLVCAAALLTFIAGPAVWAATPPAAKRPANSPEEAKGSLVIIGGSERFDNRTIWATIVELAGGRGAKIAVFPTASGVPVEYGNDIVRVLNDAGGDAFVVPVAKTGFDVKHQEAVRDGELLSKVRQSGGVFFLGGEQARLRQILATKSGRNTPMLDAIWHVYREGGVIVGTSAGAAVMSNVMYRNGRSVLSTMLHGVEMGKEIDRGFGFLDPRWFVDQHMLVRGRFARTIVTMHAQGIPYGIGVDEDSAVVVRGKLGRVIGYRGALVLDISAAKSDPDIKGFNLRNVKLTYIDRGDTIDIDTLKVTPAPEKLADRLVDPAAADFRPNFHQRAFCNDILGNMAVLDVMYRVLDNKFDDAIGLAFDGAAAQHGSTDGFEFRFYRNSDTKGWETEAFGGDDYTVLNIHCDIAPIEISGPLYMKK